MKHLLLAFAFACLVSPVFSQFHIGLSAGPNVSFWAWEIKSLGYGIDYEPAMGWRAAVLGEWQMNPMLGFRAEFGTQVKANKITGIFMFPSDGLGGIPDGTPGSFREFYQYWEGSLLVQFAPVKKFNYVYLMAGGTAGWLEKAWNKFSIIESGKASIDIKDPNWNRNAFAADFGLGGNIPLGANSKIKVEARFQYSLTDLSASDNVDASVNPLLLNIGYMHRL
ncbi:MAG: hypothetical protein Q7T20_13090 [Saprospiraceae bacterium]|nr:hypothetical protein [Saprospiraceae bacterium]